MNPFDLPGPQFLGFYAVVFLVALALALFLRWYLRQPGDQPPTEAVRLTPYEVAYLAGGAQAAVDAAIARLVTAGALGVDEAERKLTSSGDVPPSASALERVVHAAVVEEKGKENIAKVRLKAADAMAPIRERLEEPGLVVTAQGGQLARLGPLLLFLCVPVIGMIKIFVGLSRERPVGFLIGACVVTAVVAGASFGRRVHRSRRGDRALAELKNTNAALQYSVTRRAGELAGDDLVLALGLFGTAVLAGGPLAHLVTALKPPPQASSWTSSDCGGSGCGGGCGGGGCGGCGG